MTDRPIRFQIDRPVDFRFTDVRGGPRYQGRTINISSAGVLFRTDQLIGVGRRLEMIIHMSTPPTQGLGVDLRVVGMTIRTGPGWAAARVRKRQILPTAPLGTPAGKGIAPGRPAGP